MDIPKNNAQFFPQPYPSAPCDIYACSQRSKYFIGRPDGPLNICLRLCPEHAAQLVKNIPGDLQISFKPPEDHVLLTFEEVKALEDKIPAGMSLISDEDLEDLLKAEERLKALEAEEAGFVSISHERVHEIINLLPESEVKSLLIDQMVDPEDAKGGSSEDEKEEPADGGNIQGAQGAGQKRTKRNGNQ